MTNHHNSVLYTGVTNNLIRRVFEHKSGRHDGFTSKYKCNKLVYYECGENISGAIFREKQIKAGSRADKIKLIESMNPSWEDLLSRILG
jgi:putative endonuclease